jgi:hypothetical protein
MMIQFWRHFFGIADSTEECGDIIFLSDVEPASVTKSLRDLCVQGPIGSVIVYSMDGGKHFALAYVSKSGPGPESAPVLVSRKRGRGATRLCLMTLDLAGDDFCWRLATDAESALMPDF